MVKERILVVDDEYLIRWSLQQDLAKEGYEVQVAESGEEALRMVRESPPDLVLLDIQLPGIDGVRTLEGIKKLDPEIVVIMITAYAMVDTAVAAMKLGAHDYINKPYNLEGVKLSIQKGMETNRLKGEIRRLREEQHGRYGASTIIAESPAMKKVLDVVARVAASDATTVLILGESGTGKDLIAKAIHYSGARADNPFMAVNCASLPEHLLESELFGHERGAYTDAKGTKKGLFELAGEGSLFLDEIGEMRPDLQAKLLRVIEEKSFRRVGGVKDITVDVRILAASNKDLDAERAAGRFRDDLYYRLNVVPITLTPLRERREDILPLALHYIQLFNSEFGKNVSGLSPAAEKAFLDYTWPGNVRELKNILERALLLEAGETVDAADLPAEVLGSPVPAAGSPAGFELPPGGISMEKMEEELVRRALDRTGGNQTKAAALLDISRDSLRYRMKKMGLLGAAGEEGTAR
jgi:DNA-binding NtrC family response regulator